MSEGAHPYASGDLIGQPQGQNPGQDQTYDLIRPVLKHLR